MKMKVGVEEKVAFLSRPEGYPAGTKSMTARETHMSWIFMTDSHVYKLKKPVKFPYLDFTRLERREAACRAELSLNRRLAPDVYLAVQPLIWTSKGFSLGDLGRHVLEGAAHVPKGEVVDWLVVMRRLDERNTLESGLRRGDVSSADVERLVRTLGNFYQNARRLSPTRQGHLSMWRKAVEYNRRILLEEHFRLPRADIETIVAAQRGFLNQRADVLLDRVAQRRIVDAHGDLRPEHIWMTDPVRIIDCLEFDQRLRALDPLDEVAFLHVECMACNAAKVGDRVRKGLMMRLGDDQSTGLFDFYHSYRAMLRARLSIAHLLDAKPRDPEKWRPQTQAYLATAATDARRLRALLRRP